ncbi:MAG: LapA family protein [Burkholderiales bacterium]
MRLLATLAKVAVFVVLLGFAILNTDPVTLRTYFGVEWRAPLVAVLFAFFGAGAVLGVLSSLGIILRQRRRLARLTPAPSPTLPVEAAPAVQPVLAAEAAVDPSLPGRR